MKLGKKLYIMLGVCAALIIALVLWLVFKPADTTTDTSETESIDVFALSASDVQKITVTGPDNAVTLSSTFNSDGTQVWEFTSSSDSESIDYSQDTMAQYVTILSNYTAQAVIAENCEDMTDYGLEDPLYTVSLTSFTGETSEIYVGNKTFDSSACYFCIAGESTVYTTAVIKNTYCAMTEIDFLDSQLLNIDYDSISTIDFDRTSDDTHITATCTVDPETGDPTYHCTSPFDLDCSAYYGNLIEYIATLEITAFEDLSDEEITQYGLDNPTYHFMFNMKNGTYTEIYLSSEVNGYYYGKLSGLDHYFIVSTDQISGLDTPILTLLTSYINYVSAFDVSKITGSYEGQTFELEIDTESAISDDDATVTLDMRNAKITSSNDRSYAALLFESCSCIEIGGVDLEADPDISDSVLELEFIMKDHSTKTLNFVQRNDNSYYIFVDGEYSYFYTYNAELFYDGGTEITSSYGLWPAYELLVTAIDNQLNGIYDIPQ